MLIYVYLWKSVDVWQSYLKNKKDDVFLVHGVVAPAATATINKPRKCYCCRTACCLECLTWPCGSLWLSAASSLTFCVPNTSYRLPTCAKSSTASVSSELRPVITLDNCQLLSISCCHIHRWPGIVLTSSLHPLASHNFWNYYCHLFP